MTATHASIHLLLYPNMLGDRGIDLLTDRPLY